MRSILLCVILSGLIAVLIIVPHIFISNTTEEIKGILKTTDAAVKNEEWIEAEVYCLQAKNKWDKYSFWYEMITEHSAIDEIIRSMRQLERFIKEREQPEARALLAELDFMVNHLEETDNLSAENIF